MTQPGTAFPSIDAARADPAGRDPGVPRVPARQVLLSACALWLCYFVLITVRGLVVELGDFTDLLWRRGLVTLAGIVVTLACWPLLRRFDSRPLAQRVGAALVIMLPAALALAAVNQWAFAAVEKRMIERIAAPGEADDVRKVTIRSGKPGQPDVQIRRDMAGNLLVDVMDDAMAPPAPPPPSPPAPPPPSPPSPTPPVPPAPETAASAPPQSGAPARDAIVIHKQDDGAGLWRQLTDVALGRYFLLIAWAALYLALGNGEQLRAAEYREGEYRRAAKAAELRSLRYQVNPHFLFNALNSLSALVMVGRGEQAERMIQSISRFYRHSLAAEPTADVPLEDEIALQRHYLEIEAVRFPERLQCEFDVPPELMGACVPGMILQPLVENSIKYAVSTTTRAVTIRIAAREAGGFLVLSVADDGPGGTLAGGGTGIGLANVRSRLAARFGADGAKVESGPLPAGGYATVLTLPVVRNEC